MKLRHVLLMLGLMLAGPVMAEPAVSETAQVESTWTPAGARQKLAVESQTFDWFDSKRQRAVPVRLWFPASEPGPHPVVVFSHGLGGTRDGYEYLGRFLAENGFVVIHPQHVGSDDSVWRGKARPMAAMREATRNLAEIMARPEDIGFVLDEAARLNEEEGPFKGKFDLSRAAVAGHSFGAYTALAASGRRLANPRTGQSINLQDPRLKACIALSPPASQSPTNGPSYAEFQLPCLHMTGTLDSSPVNGNSAEDRRIPYDSIKATDQYLVTLAGGDHMVFSGRRNAAEEAADDAEAGRGALGRRMRDSMRQREGSGMNGDPARDPILQEIIKDSMLAFLRGHVMQDPQALEWLRGDGFFSRLGGDATLERK